MQLSPDVVASLPVGHIWSFTGVFLLATQEAGAGHTTPPSSSTASPTLHPPPPPGLPGLNALSVSPPTLPSLSPLPPRHVEKALVEFGVNQHLAAAVKRPLRVDTVEPESLLTFTGGCVHLAAVMEGRGFTSGETSCMQQQLLQKTGFD